jgi:hypothetical protein
MSDLELIETKGKLPSALGTVRGWFASFLLVGCAATGLEALPQGSPARPDAPVTPVPPVGRVLADADPLAWPPLRPAAGGHHHHGPGSQPVGTGSQPVGPGSQPVGAGSQPVGAGSQPVVAPTTEAP